MNIFKFKTPKGPVTTTFSKIKTKNKPHYRNNWILVSIRSKKHPIDRSTKFKKHDFFKGNLLLWCTVIKMVNQRWQHNTLNDCISLNLFVGWIFFIEANCNFCHFFHIYKKTSFGLGLVVTKQKQQIVLLRPSSAEQKLCSKPLCKSCWTCSVQLFWNNL